MTGNKNYPSHSKDCLADLPIYANGNPTEVCSNGYDKIFFGSTDNDEVDVWIDHLVQDEDDGYSIF